MEQDCKNSRMSGANANGAISFDTSIEIQNTRRTPQTNTEHLKFCQRSHRHAEARSRENLPMFSFWCCIALGWVAARSGVPVFNQSQVQISPHCHFYMATREALSTTSNYYSELNWHTCLKQTLLHLSSSSCHKGHMSSHALLKINKYSPHVK